MVLQFRDVNSNDVLSKNRYDTVPFFGTDENI